jgi:hypothetical protein
MYAPLTVRLVEREPTARLNPRTPEPFALEVGFPILTKHQLKAKHGGDTKEHGLMVACLFSKLEDLPEAMHLVADLWQHQLEHDSAMAQHARAHDELEVFFSLPNCRGSVELKPQQLGTDLHKLADVLIARDRTKSTRHDIPPFLRKGQLQ